MIILPLFHAYALNSALGMVAYTGATAILSERFDPLVSLRSIHVHRATVVVTAPPVYAAWSETRRAGEALTSVRLLISGAAPLACSVFAAFVERIGQPVWEGTA